MHYFQRRICKEEDNEWLETTAITPFLFLSLDIPPTPLFKDREGGNIIPQVLHIQIHIKHMKLVSHILCMIIR
jgi:hypothetical protein